MNRLLLVEDDESLAMGIEFSLKDEGYEVHRASGFVEGKQLFETMDFQLVILDVNLQDGNGYDLCKHIRKSSDVPVMFLTALDEEVNIVLGLEIGGDDYITKPFGVREFLSRVKVLLRRNSRNNTGSMIMKSGRLAVDTSMAKVKLGVEELTLTAQEYKLLLIFMNKPLMLVHRDEILNELTEGVGGGGGAYFDENTLSVYIRRLREKIEEKPRNPEFIVTQRGLGYRWDKEVVKE